MAERAKPKAKAAAKPAAKASAAAAVARPVLVRGSGERMPSEYLRRRSAMFQSITQGAGKPMCYPSPTTRPK